MTQVCCDYTCAKSSEVFTCSWCEIRVQLKDNSSSWKRRDETWMVWMLY